MEELKLLVGMVASLPQMALWVIAAFFAYKVCVIGSIYGVIKLAINKTHAWLTMPKVELKQVRPMLDAITIKDALEPLIAQIDRIAHLDGGSGCYIHKRQVNWLREAIDEKLEKEKEKSSITRC